MIPIQTFGRFTKLPAGSIQPTGCLRKWAEAVAGGWLADYTRHKDPGVYGRLWHRSQGGDVAFTDTGETIWPPDYGAYYADGLIRNALFLPGSELSREAEQWARLALASQDADGYLGAFAPPGRWQHWLEIFTQSLVIEALLAHYEATGDAELLQACEHAASAQRQAWANSDDRRIFSTHGAIATRAMCRLYALTGNATYLDFARDVLAAYGKTDSYCHPGQKWWYTQPGDMLAGEHVVMETQHVGLPAILYEYTGCPELLAASRSAWQMMVDFHLSVTGTPHGNEPMFRVGPRESSEHCAVIEWIATSGVLARVTGETKYADEVERAIYNAYPAAKSADGMTVAYMHAPNQLVAAEWGSSPFYDNVESNCRQHYHSAHEPLCCNANSPRGLPNFIEHMVMSCGDGLAVVCYGPCQARTLIPDAGEVVVRIDTSYPFEDRVRVTVTPARTATFTLRLRIPGWCQATSLTVNGQAQPAPQPGTYAEVRRSWAPGDWVDICFDIPCRLVHWRGADFGLREPGVVVQRGPLTFALPVPEVWRRFDPPASAPVQKPGHAPTAYRVLPAEAAAWNYALCIDPADPARSFKLVALGAQGNSEPWQSPPIGLLTKARRVKNWLMDGTPSHPQTPGLPYRPSETAPVTEIVTLVPFGFTHLRLTYLPIAQEGDCV